RAAGRCPDAVGILLHERKPLELDSVSGELLNRGVNIWYDKTKHGIARRLQLLDSRHTQDLAADVKDKRKLVVAGQPQAEGVSVERERLLSLSCRHKCHDGRLAEHRHHS